MSLPIFNLATTQRHFDLMITFYNAYRQQKNKDARDYFSAGNTALVYAGYKLNLSEVYLYDANSFERFPNGIYNTVEPDFMLFLNNKFILNDKTTWVLGQPDLAVEIWSDANTAKDKEFKQYLYSTSPITEHWYLTQTTNEVECFMGKTILDKQSLLFPLKTQSGVVFDLRELAV